DNSAPPDEPGRLANSSTPAHSPVAGASNPTVLRAALPATTFSATVHSPHTERAAPARRSPDLPHGLHTTRSALATTHRSTTHRRRCGGSTATAHTPAPPASAAVPVSRGHATGQTFHFGPPAFAPQSPWPAALRQTHSNLSATDAAHGFRALPGALYRP